MADFTTASSLLLALVLAVALGIAVTVWLAADRVGDRRLRFIAAGFGVLALKSAVSIYTVQTDAIHHEVAEMIGSVFDIGMVSLIAAPFWMRE